MNFPIDSYELRARYAPSLIVVTPFLITLWACAPTEFQGVAAFSGGILSIVVWYSFSVFVRYCGKRAEKQIWNEPSEKPVVSFLLWNNNMIGRDLKMQYHKVIYDCLHLPTWSPEFEEGDPLKAAQYGRQAFVRAKGVVRRLDPNGLWYIDLADYGFARNLYGARWYWVGVSVCMSFTSLFLVLLGRSSDMLILGLIMNIFMLLFSFVFGRVLGDLSKEIALRYAQHFWESFLNLSENVNYDKRIEGKNGN
ncbi:hypothetical protein NNJEOMEG_03277 [Fundidesulfovibrio magnetotacticus]|uniref:Uncharacterized protein n=1 Tax=Fundidesulfovibrio magnetotacticus TaxID=2730080 RepID=A0A6V8LUK3_9BACT|nr:hypothetical protein [Fundidesulfovibrio magnetotacticus]GFK95414.1 hypothetical protein NNJEOMEG_03277 [Fundidesulfovibrio magnetotacticus]